MSELISNIIKKFGSQVALAAAINVSQSTVAQWKRRGSIPAKRQVKILEAARSHDIDLAPADFFPKVGEQ